MTELPKEIEAIYSALEITATDGLANGGLSMVGAALVDNKIVIDLFEFEKEDLVSSQEKVYEEVIEYYQGFSRENNVISIGVCVRSELTFNDLNLKINALWVWVENRAGKIFDIYIPYSTSQSGEYQFDERIVVERAEPKIFKG